MKSVIQLALLALAGLVATPLAAVAQNYPAKTVRVIIPWPPGGSNDIVGRLVMQKMGEKIGRAHV